MRLSAIWQALFRPRMSVSETAVDVDSYGNVTVLSNALPSEILARMTHTPCWVVELLAGYIADQRPKLTMVRLKPVERPAGSSLDHQEMAKSRPTGASLGGSLLMAALASTALPVGEKPVVMLSQFGVVPIWLVGTKAGWHWYGTKPPVLEEDYLLYFPRAS